MSKELTVNIDKDYAEMMKHLVNGTRLRLTELLVSAVKKQTHRGSTTCVMVHLDERDSFLSTCNLGDSAYLICRFGDNGEVEKVYRSKEQQYGFDFPFQCGTYCDLPYDADELIHSVLPNDIVMLASDGVTDNLFDEEMMPCFEKAKIQGELIDVQTAADCIADLASKTAKDKTKFTPMQKSAASYGRVKGHEGGKVDDITVIVGQIIREV